jgi:hypothetical protein
VLEEVKDRLIKLGWGGKIVRTSQIDIRVKQLNRIADPKGKRVDEIYRWGIKRMELEGLSIGLRSLVLARLRSIEASEADARLTTPRNLRSRNRSFEPRETHTPSRIGRHLLTTEHNGKPSVLIKPESSPYGVSRSTETPLEQ